MCTKRCFHLREQTLECTCSNWCLVACMCWYYEADMEWWWIRSFGSFSITIFLRNHQYDLQFCRLALRIISLQSGHSEQVCSIASGLMLSLSAKFAQGPTRSFWRDVCSPYFWQFQFSWNCLLILPVFTVLRLGKDGRYGFQIFRKYRRLAFAFSLLVRLIWFREIAKLSKFVLSRMN